MGCSKCGGGNKSAKKCCLCGKPKGQFLWGNQRKICRKCKKKMEAEMIENENMAIRTRTLLAGKDFNWKELEKWKKYWYAKSVEKL